MPRQRQGRFKHRSMLRTAMVQPGIRTKLQLTFSRSSNFTATSSL